MHYRFRKYKPFFIRCNTSSSYESRSQTWASASGFCGFFYPDLASASVGGGRIAPDEERLILSKPVVHFSFTYGVLGGLLYNYFISHDMLSGVLINLNYLQKPKFSLYQKRSSCETCTIIRYSLLQV